jgi:hypothetical protein
MIFSVLSNLLFLLPRSSTASGSFTSRIEKLDGICSDNKQCLEEKEAEMVRWNSTDGKDQTVQMPGRRS